MKRIITHITENRIFPIVLLLVLSCSFIGIFYSNVIFNPNKYLFNDRGDAVKNYFTYASQINEEELTQTSIMNYPYGESFLYLDCQPALTMPLQALSKLFPSISQYSVGIINFLMLFSIVITSFFIYLILCEFKVNRLYAALCAFAIGVLSPQILRITGHLALGYSFVIPVLWYLFIRFCKSDSSKLIWSIALGAAAMIFFLLHGYLGMISLLLILFCYIFYLFLVLRKEKPFDKKQILYFSIQIIAPLLFYYLFMSLTDHHVGRTDNPWGFFESSASYETVFLPLRELLNSSLKKILPMYKQTWEGLAYIGIFSVIVLYYCLIRLIFNSKYMKDFWKDNPLLKVSFLAGFCILFVSMGYPFKLGLQPLLDWIPQIKNFRAIGRFAWGFYYVTTVFTVVFLYQTYKSSKYRKILIVFLLLLPVSFYVEGIPHHKMIRNEMISVPNAFKNGHPTKNYAEALEMINCSDYQAIIPLPFYQMVTENYEKLATEEIYFSSMTFAYHSKIPLMGCYSTRLSIPESKNKLALLSPPFYPKKLKEDISDDRPFLILYSHNELSAAESYILNKAKKLFSSNEFSLFRISKEQLFENTANQEISDFVEIENSLIPNNGFLCSDSNALIAYRSFDTLDAEYTYRGKGAWQSKKEGVHILYEIMPDRLDENQEYTVSVWMRNEWDNYGQDYLNCNFIVEEIDENGTVEYIAFTNPIHNFIFNDSWSMVEVTFKPSNVQNKINILYTGGEKPKDAIYFIDDLIIYKTGAKIYRIEQKNHLGDIIELFKNNHKITRM